MKAVALNYFQVSFRFDNKQTDVDTADAALETVLNQLGLDYRHCNYFEEAVVKYIRTELTKSDLKSILDKNVVSPVSTGMIRSENAKNSPKRAMYGTIEDYFDDQKLENIW